MQGKTTEIDIIKQLFEKLSELGEKNERKPKRKNK